MNVFLAEMLKYLARCKGIIAMDCTGWHKPKNLILRNEIKNKIFPTKKHIILHLEVLRFYLTHNSRTQ